MQDLILLRLKRSFQKNIKQSCLRIKNFYKFCLSRKISKSQPLPQFSSPKSQKLLPQILSEKQIFKLLEQPISFENNSGKPDFKQIRDLLILELLYATGLRVSELININYEDINFSNASVKVLGKEQAQTCSNWKKNAKIINRISRFICKRFFLSCTFNYK